MIHCCLGIDEIEKNNKTEKLDNICEDKIDNESVAENLMLDINFAAHKFQK